MRFENVFYLYLLWLTPLLAFFFIYIIRKRTVLLQKFCDSKLLLKINSGFSLNRRKIKYGMLVIAFILIIMSLARPQIGFNWEDINRKGVDIYVVLDVSDSMLSEDIKPNRLEIAKRKLTDFISMLQGDRVGLILFAGASIIQCPLTTDYNALQMFVEEISTQSVPVKGTSITTSLQMAFDSFARSSESSSKAIILITDGEDHDGNIKEIEDKAKKIGVTIYAIGIGSEQGSYIPLGNGEYKTDAYGNKILSKPNFTKIKDLSIATGGIYTNAVTGNFDLESIYLQGIKKVLKQADLASDKRKKWIDRYQWFLAVAFALIIGEFFLSEKLKNGNVR